MTQEEKIKIGNKFVNDPDWSLVERLLTDYIEPLKDIATIDTKQQNDIIATEVRSRQIVIDQLSKFLRDSRLIGKNINNLPVTFK